MDFSNVTAMYGNMYSTAANQTASKLQNQLKGTGASATTDELMDACKQFEAYFIEQVYKGMMKTIPTNDDNMSNYTSTMMDYYKDQMIQNMASQTADQGGGLGLAQMLYEQMKRNFGITEIPAVDGKENGGAVSAVSAE